MAKMGKPANLGLPPQFVEVLRKDHKKLSTAHADERFGAFSVMYLLHPEKPDDDRVSPSMIELAGQIRGQKIPPKAAKESGCYLRMVPLDAFKAIIELYVCQNECVQKITRSEAHEFYILATATVEGEDRHALVLVDSRTGKTSAL